jgi:hypothetical protein
MKRRHLFDNGFPVSTPTLVAGSEVLLALARCSLRNSRAKLILSWTALAESADRVCVARRQCEYTRDITHGPAPARIESPASRAACEEPHRP